MATGEVSHGCQRLQEADTGDAAQPWNLSTALKDNVLPDFQEFLFWMNSMKPIFLLFESMHEVERNTHGRSITSMNLIVESVGGPAPTGRYMYRRPPMYYSSSPVHSDQGMPLRQSTMGDRAATWVCMYVWIRDRLTHAPLTMSITFLMASFLHYFF